MSEETKALHWLVVGYVSPETKQTIEELGGQVREVSTNPLLIAVALPHDPAGYWSWSHGERQHRSAIEFWNTGEIQMEHITLQYGPRNAEYCSAHETYLIQPWEEFDAGNQQVSERQTAPALPVVPNTTTGDDFDPFLDFDESLP